MENSYSQIKDHLARNERSRHYNIFLHTPEQEQEILNNEGFLKVNNLLKNKFQVLFKLMGEANFKNLSYEYFKYNPIHSSKMDSYGKTFPDFIASLTQLSNFKYLKWLAKLDWFWFNPIEEGQTIQLPKGTLSSWSSVLKAEDNIEIWIDESIIENLRVEKNGSQISLKSM